MKSKNVWWVLWYWRLYNIFKRQLNYKGKRNIALNADHLPVVAISIGKAVSITVVTIAISWVSAVQVHFRVELFEWLLKDKCWSCLFEWRDKRSCSAIYTLFFSARILIQKLRYFNSELLYSYAICSWSGSKIF